MTHRPLVFFFQEKMMIGLALAKNQLRALIFKVFIR
jgi:hypothetical protein